MDSGGFCGGGFDIPPDPSQNLDNNMSKKSYRSFLFRSLIALAFGMCQMSVCAGQPESDFGNHIVMTVQINGQKAHLVFDTGADTTVLFRKSAERLGMKIIEPALTGAPANVVPGRVLVKNSEPVRLTFGGKDVMTSFKILDAKVSIAFDGILSWNDFQGNLMRIDGASGTVTFLGKLPAGVEQWPHWKLVDRSKRNLGSKWLGFEISSLNGRPGAVYIDTGADQGISLSARQMEAWKAANPNPAVTMDADYCPGLADGLVVHDVYWATNLKLTDGLSFSNVAISICFDSEAHIPNYDARLGMFAITQMDIIVDRLNKTIYIKPAVGKSNAPYYNYNRIGAVFTPRSLTGGDLIARVLKDSSAYEAGVRDGDVLTKIGNLDATKWTTDPRILPLGRFWSQPAGNKINIECRRGDQILKFTITMKEIFPGPASKNNTPPK
jgi:hypothetical protein